MLPPNADWVSSPVSDNCTSNAWRADTYFQIGDTFTCVCPPYTACHDPFLRTSTYSVLILPLPATPVKRRLCTTKFRAYVHARSACRNSTCRGSHDHDAQLMVCKGTLVVPFHIPRLWIVQEICSKYVVLLSHQTQRITIELREHAISRHSPP